jgi:hypothetical protein
MRSPLVTVLLLIASNVFMTFAWYAHLRNMASRPWWAAAIYMRQPVSLNFVWAGLCLMGAVYFMFR